MSTEEDDELRKLLADESRVRDALLAAVDGQLVPPVRTDLVDIVQRGKRRARLQVVGASVAAVVLIAAVALGATVLGRLGGTRVDTAGGGSTSLPVTSQTITTTSNPPIPSSYYADAACVYPALAPKGTPKWVPLSPEQMAQFQADVSDFRLGPVQTVDPAIANALSPSAQEGTTSLKLTVNGRTILLTVSASAYSGNGVAAAGRDGQQIDVPGVCASAVSQAMLGKAVVDEFTPIAIKSMTDGPMYLRAQLYSSVGIRYDVTEVVDADSLLQYGGTATNGPSANMPGTGSWAYVPLQPTELAQFAFQLATMQ
jgi:hypothetical protein